MFSHLPSITILDGKNGVLKAIKGDSYINEIYPKKLLQEKIFDTKRAQNEQFAAVLRGIENEDVTTYVCSYFRNQGLEELEKNGVYLRFPHSGDGYWEDYFLKLNDEEFLTLEDGTILSKQEKFIHDLNLHEKQDGFAIVPFKYNGHFVTLVVDCSQKTINLFDSSLYTVFGNEEKSEAFRGFLLGNPKVLDRTSITNNTHLLNHFDVQGERLEDEAGKKLEAPRDVEDCYDMGKMLIVVGVEISILK